MSISPPPFSPSQSASSEEDNNDYLNKLVDDDDEYIDSPETLISSFDLYKNAIDRLRSSAKSQSTEQQQSSLEHFKSLSMRSNAWLYMRIHDDLFSILLEHFAVDNASIQSTVLSIFANIACERASHEQIFETDLIDVVCQKLADTSQVDIINRCFRLLGNVCTAEDAARRMIDGELARTMGNVLRTCTDPECLHSIIRCSRKLSTYAFCREPMLDSMCLLSVCKQLFAAKVLLRKEAMKAVQEWDVESSDRSRSQLREGDIFRFLITSIEAKSDKEYRHIAFRLLNSLLRHSDMRTEFGLRQGLDFLLNLITKQLYHSTYEHLKFIGLFCVCCQETNNRRLIKEDNNKLQLFFDYLGKYQYRSNFLDLLLTAIGQFIYDDQSLNMFVKQMQFIERLSDLLETVVMVKYEDSEKKSSADDHDDARRRKRVKREHTTTAPPQQRVSMTIDFNESLFTEFVENTHLDDERQTSSSTPAPPTNTNIEIRRRTEALIFTLLSKLSYENTDIVLRRSLFNPRLVSLLLRYIHLCDEPNPRAVRILSRLTKMVDCTEHLAELGLPYLIGSTFFRAELFKDVSTHASKNDQYLYDVLISENRAFFQRLSWTNEYHRLKTIEHNLMKNIENAINTPYAANEIARRLNDSTVTDKSQLMLTIAAAMKEHHLKPLFVNMNYLTNQCNVNACFWALRVLAHRCLSSDGKTYLTEFLDELQARSRCPAVTQPKTATLNINSEHLLTVNSHLLCQHSDYFQALFNGPFSERQQAVIPIHLPDTVASASFTHFVDLLENSNEPVQSSRVADLCRLCDQYLVDYLPYRLVRSVLERFLHEVTTVEVVDIVSKPNLISALIRACFMHLLASKTHISLEVFAKLVVVHPAELDTTVRALLEHQCWFRGENSPFAL